MIHALKFPEPPLRSEVVSLRPWTTADLEDALAGARDPLVPHFTHIRADHTLETITEHFASHEPSRLAGEELHFAMADARSDRFLGAISIFGFDHDADAAELGYWLAPWGRGRGVATSAVSLVSTWAFEHLPVDQLKLLISDDNIASLKLAARAGYESDGTAPVLEEHNGRQRRIVTLIRTR